MAEAVTALGPTRLQHCASCAGAHACAKAVLAGLASVVGLKGALHGASYWDKLRMEHAVCMKFLCQRHETNVVHRLTGSRPPQATSGHPGVNLEYPQALTTVKLPARTAGTAIHTLWIVLWTTS